MGFEDIDRKHAAAGVPQRWAGVIPLVEQILAEEGATVEFTGQNPDFNEAPNERVTVCQGPDFVRRDYGADTLQEALEAAIAWRKAQADKPLDEIAGDFS